MPGRLSQLLFFCLTLGFPYFGAAPAAAQTGGAVSGFVTDAATGETLLLANVVIQGTAIGAATNNAGFYAISGLAPGRYTVVVSYLGYQTARRDVVLAPGEAVRLDVALRPAALAGDEVVVTAERVEEEERTAIGVGHMPTRLVTDLPAVFEADVFRSLQLLPGIKAANDFSSGLYIRGGGPDQTMILLDRTTVYNPSHFFGLFSTFNPDALKDVQVYKGTYPAEYGGRLGSVLDVYNKDGNREEVRGKVSVGLLASRASLEGPYGRGSWMLAVRRSTLEPLLAMLRSSGETVPDAFYFYDVNGKVNFDAGQDDRLSLAFYGGTDRLRIQPVVDMEIDMPYGNRTGSLTWTHLFSRRMFTSFTATGSRYFSLPVFSFGGTTSERRNEVYEASFKADLEYAASRAHTLEAGLWAGDLLLKLRDGYDGETVFGTRTRTAYAAVYAQETWRPTARWTLRGGLRLNAFAAGGYARLEPRLSVAYQPLADLRLQAAYGRYYQFVTLITSEAFTGDDVWLATDEGVPPAWGDQLGLGLKATLPGGYRLDAEVYYRTMEDLFELDPYLQDPSGLAYPDLFHFGDGYAYGAELLVEKTRGRTTGFVAYTFGRTWRRFPGVNGGRYYPPRYDRTHDLSLVLAHDLARRWRATAAFTVATGQATTRVLGVAQFDDPFSTWTWSDFTVGRVNASRLPLYHRLDVGVTRTGRFFGFADYELQLQAVNVYNRRNVWFYDYDHDYNPPRPEPIHMLPILPNLSLTLSF